MFIYIYILILFLFAYSIMEDTQEQVVKIKRSKYNKERYEDNKDCILKYRKIDNFQFLAGKYFLAGVLDFGGKIHGGSFEFGDNLILGVFIFGNSRIFPRHIYLSLPLCVSTICQYHLSL